MSATKSIHQKQGFDRVESANSSVSHYFQTKRTQASTKKSEKKVIVVRF